MKTQQKGFTLIELVVVIVLLGIIGAVATARFQDLSTEARTAAVGGIAAEIQSSSAINYAKGVLQDPPTFQTAIVAATTCATASAALLTSSAVPTGWTVTGVTTGCGTAGTPVTCTLTNDADALVTATFTLICTG
jgi:MSHA pilin protein MshA